VSDPSTSKETETDSTMDSDKPVAAFADALKRKDESAFEVTHRKEAGATRVKKGSKGKKPRPNQHNMFANGVSGKQGEYAWKGLPYKGKPADFKHDDPVNMQPMLRHKACIKQFDFSDETDMEEYAKVMQAICDGTTTLSFEEKIYDENIKSWRILLRYLESYYQAPPTIQE